MQRILTGITTTGSPHLGNFVGAIRPALRLADLPNTEAFYFLADYHALVKCQQPERVQRSTLEIAASWLALGLDPARVHFYRQSDIPEIPELTWLLSCVAAKGLLNRAHAYKSAAEENLRQELDEDAGITMGLFNYPVLMAADILIFRAHQVPVGRDQVQHIEIARDLAQRFNHLFGQEHFVLPQAKVDDHVALLPGLDGRKMSKSYDNTIPLWLPRDKLRKQVMRIVTNSLEPGVPKDPDDSHLYTIYQAFAGPQQSVAMRQAFADGIAWGEAKEALFEVIDSALAPARERYEALIANPGQVEAALQQGAAKARGLSQPFLRELRHAVGLRTLVAGAPGGGKKAAKVQDASTRGARLARLVEFRDREGHFQCRLLAAEGPVLLTSVACADANALARVKALLTPERVAAAEPEGGSRVCDDEGRVIAAGAGAVDAVREALRQLGASAD